MEEIITDQVLIDAGYTKYEKSIFDSSGSECKFQKRVDDEKGKKYFIDVTKWGPWQHAHTGEIVPQNYEFNLCLRDAATDRPVAIKLYGSWTLADVEKRAADFWNMGVWKYYDLF